jgi:hypothetical protein
MRLDCLFEGPTFPSLMAHISRRHPQATPDDFVPGLIHHRPLSIPDLAELPGLPICARVGRARVPRFTQLVEGVDGQVKTEVDREDIKGEDVEKDVEEEVDVIIQPKPCPGPIGTRTKKLVQKGCVSGKRPRKEDWVDKVGAGAAIRALVENARRLSRVKAESGEGQDQEAGGEGERREEWEKGGEEDAEAEGEVGEGKLVVAEAEEDPDAEGEDELDEDPATTAVSSKTQASATQQTRSTRLDARTLRNPRTPRIPKTPRTAIPLLDVNRTARVARDEAKRQVAAGDKSARDGYATTSTSSASVSGSLPPSRANSAPAVSSRKRNRDDSGRSGSRDTDSESSTESASGCESDSVGSPYSEYKAPGVLTLHLPNANGEKSGEASGEVEEGPQGTNGVGERVKRSERLRRKAEGTFPGSGVSSPVDSPKRGSFP